MARTSKTTTTRKKRTAKAKVAPAPLFDRDPYEGWTDSELKAHAENVAAQDPLNMLRKRLKAVTGLELAETTLRGHLAVQHPFLLRAFLSTSAEGGYEAKRLVIDTAVANIARLDFPVLLRQFSTPSRGGYILLLILPPRIGVENLSK